MTALPDGVYSVLVIDVEEIDAASLRVELAVTSGDNKGDVVAVRAPRVQTDALDMLGLPGTLRVRAGAPHFELDA